MSTGYPDDYDRSYQPYRNYGPTGSGMLDMGLTFARMAAPGMFNNSGTFNSTFSNVQQQHSRANADLAYRQMMSDASRPMRNSIGNFLSAMPTTTQVMGGQPYTPAQQRAYAGLADTLMSFGLPEATRYQTGRMFLDAVSPGGAAQANTAAAIGVNLKRMYDPFKMAPNLTARSGTAMVDALHANLFGGSDLATRVGMQGYGTADLLPMVNYGTTRGGFVDTALEGKLVRSRSFMSAVQSGNISREDLDRMGIGDLTGMADTSLSVNDRERKVMESVGSRAGKKVRDMTQAMRAVQELISPDSGLIEVTSETLHQMEAFTAKYERQLSGKQIARNLRQTQAALKDFGYTYTEFSRMQTYADAVGESYGYRAGASNTFMRETAGYVGNLLGSGAFAVPAYGAMNVDEATRQYNQDMAGYGKSAEGSALATIVRRAQDTEYAFTSDAAGERASKLIRALESGAATGDATFDNASPTEKMRIVSQGMQGDDNYQRMVKESQYSFVNERTFITEGLASYTASAQQRDFLKGAGAIAADSAMVSLGKGMSDTGRSRIINNVLNKGLGAELMSMSNTTAADRKLSKGQLGTYIYDTLSRMAASGDEDAVAAFNNLGTTDEERRKRANVLGAQYISDIENMTNAPVVDLVTRIGDYSIAGSRQASRVANVKAFVAEMLADSTNTNVADSIQAAAAKLGKREGGDPLSMAEMAEVLHSSLKDDKDPLTRSQIEKSLNRLLSDGQKLESMMAGGGDSQDAAFKDEVARQRMAVEAAANELKEMFKTEDAGKDNVTPEDKAASDAATGEGKGGSPSVDSVTVVSPTFVFENLTVTANGPSKSLPQTTGNV